MSDPDCPRCGHAASRHWPDHGAPTTACTTCLTEGIQSTEADGTFRGTCCHSTDSIKAVT